MFETREQNLDLSNLFHPELLDDPYPFFRRMRETSRIRWDHSLNGWTVTHYADCLAVLLDARLDDFAPLPQQVPLLEPYTRIFSNSFTSLGLPEYPHLHNRIWRAFTPSRMEQLRPTVQKQTDNLLDAVIPSGRMDVIRDLASPLTITALAHLLSIPTEDVSRFVAGCVLRRFTHDSKSIAEFST